MPQRRETQKDHQERISQVLAYVRDNGERDLTVAELATVAQQSPFHFERVFQEQTGRRPGQHVRHFRLVQAAMALRLTDQKVVDIALAANYANHESFSRAFRNHFGCSPTQFRSLQGEPDTVDKGKTMSQFKINLVKIPVTDFARATQYYRETIGLEEEFAVAAYGWAQYKVAGIPLCLYTVGMGGGDGVPGGEAGFHLAVENIDHFYQGFIERGGIVDGEIVSSDDGGKFAVIRDIDGNQFKVVQAVI